jgi:ferredoxin-thioredoxin reductase catalytic subunit
MMKKEPGLPQAEELFHKLQSDAKRTGYYLNPDDEFTRGLVEALLVNTQRYGYPSCPCRLADGVRAEDLDIICPCDYRDPDLADFGACYCALYVSKEIAKGEKQPEPIPERRPPKEERKKGVAEGPSPAIGGIEGGEGKKRSDLPYPVHRCKVCGYLCARAEPPEKCPVCGADKDRFERFL